MRVHLSILDSQAISGLYQSPQPFSISILPIPDKQIFGSQCANKLFHQCPFEFSPDDPIYAGSPLRDLTFCVVALTVGVFPLYSYQHCLVSAFVFRMDREWRRGKIISKKQLLKNDSIG